ncbi:MAG: thrombospondin type 3 repeat-containing protein [Gammaproteobacteria bacterium]|nr:thrombospondin type 3 repeat-containing protein [Gammaproteobacteria bacterium]
MIKIIALPILVVQAAMVYGAAITDSDHDGVPDALDKCPDTVQLKKLPVDFKYAAAVNPERLEAGNKAHPVDKNGCEPDSDGDGVVNSQDYCPQDSKEALSRGIAENGCPKHSDADGTPDYRDKCPNTPKGVKTDKYGCQL